VSTLALEIKQHVYTLIKALPEFADVDVTYGVPKRFDKRWCALGRVRWDSSDWATNRSREETFSLEGLVSIVQTAGDSASCEAAALALGSVIEDAIKADPGLGNARVVTSGFKPSNVSSFPNDAEGYEAQYEWTISVTARL
jgi:hypothetical protein